jgi:hypothetical protein
VVSIYASEVRTDDVFRVLQQDGHRTGLAGVWHRSA